MPSGAALPPFALPTCRQEAQSCSCMLCNANIFQRRGFNSPTSCSQGNPTKSSQQQILTASVSCHKQHHYPNTPTMFTTVDGICQRGKEHVEPFRLSRRTRGRNSLNLFHLCHTTSCGGRLLWCLLGSCQSAAQADLALRALCSRRLAIHHGPAVLQILRCLSSHTAMDLSSKVLYQHGYTAALPPA